MLRNQINPQGGGGVGGWGGRIFFGICSCNALLHVSLFCTLLVCTREATALSASKHETAHDKLEAARSSSSSSSSSSSARA